jgi:hypothetical protein
MKTEREVLCSENRRRSSPVIANTSSIHVTKLLEIGKPKITKIDSPFKFKLLINRY